MAETYTSTVAADGAAVDEALTKANSALQGSTGSVDNAILRADGTEGGTAQAGTNAPTYSDTGLLTVAPAAVTGSDATSGLELNQTWNTTGNPTALKVNVTNTASGASANLLDLQVDGGSAFKLTKDGGVVFKNNYFGLPFIGQLFNNSGDPTIGTYTTTTALLGLTKTIIPESAFFGFGNPLTQSFSDVSLSREAANVLCQRNKPSGANAQESRLYGSYTSATAYQRLSTKTLREAVTAASGASVTTTISIPKYTHLIGVTTRVTTALGETNGTTGYTVGDGTDPDLWGAVTGVAGGTTTDRRDFTAVDALGPDGSDRTITLTATGGNFDGTGVIEVCAFYLAAEAD